MALQKGQSGNPSGTRKERLWRDAIIAAAKASDSEGDLRMALKRLAAKLVDNAEDGDMLALKEIGQRLDGAPEASVNVEHSGSVTHEHTPVSETAAWLAGITGTGADSAPDKPVPH